MGVSENRGPKYSNIVPIVGSLRSHALILICEECRALIFRLGFWGTLYYNYNQGFKDKGCHSLTLHSSMYVYLSICIYLYLSM